LSTLLKTSLFVFAGILFSGCTEDQSKAIGNIPKNTIDKASADVNKAMQQSAERLQEKKE
jgi:hypothetical protein